MRRAMLAVTRPERSPSAAALVEALRAEGAALSRAFAATSECRPLPELAADLLHSSE